MNRSGLIAHQAGPDNTPPMIATLSPEMDSILQRQSSRIGNIIFFQTAY